MRAGTSHVQIRGLPDKCAYPTAPTRVEAPCSLNGRVVGLTSVVMPTSSQEPVLGPGPGGRRPDRPDARGTGCVCCAAGSCTAGWPAWTGACEVRVCPTLGPPPDPGAAHNHVRTVRGEDRACCCAGSDSGPHLDLLVDGVVPRWLRAPLQQPLWFSCRPPLINASAVRAATPSRTTHASPTGAGDPLCSPTSTTSSSGHDMRTAESPGEWSSGSSMSRLWEARQPEVRGAGQAGRSSAELRHRPKGRSARR